jgi:hypothetical protein
MESTDSLTKTLATEDNAPIDAEPQMTLVQYLDFLEQFFELFPQADVRPFRPMLTPDIRL